MRSARRVPLSEKSPRGFTIKVRLGTKVAQIAVDFTKPLSSFALSFALKFTAEQRLFLKVIGLKLVELAPNSTTPLNTEYEFIEDTEIHCGTVMKMKDMKKLERGAVYELMILDKRDDLVNQLTDEELEEIRGHFDSMDLDKNGVLTTDEVVEYHRKEMDKNILASRKITDRKIQADPVNRDKYMSEFYARQNFYKNTLEQNVKFFMQIDSDSSGSVSWQEFLAHTSRSKIRVRKMKEQSSSAFK